MIFQFREFSIKQKDSAMKVGTDSVLLGSFCETGNAKYILDIGSGTGLLALMLAQKSTAQIVAVEPDLAAYRECVFNFDQSPWKERLQSISGKVQDIPYANKYDLIITNPPYYRKLHSIPIDNQQRSLARHDLDLPLESLCDELIQRLSATGTCWLILPVREANIFMALAQERGLFLQQRIKIQPNPRKEINRMILCFSLKQMPFTEIHFAIYNQDGSPTLDYIKRTKDYYLWKQFDADFLAKL